MKKKSWLIKMKKNQKIEEVAAQEEKEEVAAQEEVPGVPYEEVAEELQERAKRGASRTTNVVVSSGQGATITRPVTTTVCNAEQILLPKIYKHT